MNLVTDISSKLNDLLHGEIHPTIGLHRDIPEEEYHRWHAVSNSWLNLLLASPAHLRYALEHPQDETDSLRVGKAVHRAVLEPERFDELYIRGPAGNWTHVGPKAEVASLRARFPKGIVLKPDEYDQIIAARDAIQEHPLASKLLDNPEYGYEVSACWQYSDAAGELKCKARADILRPDLGTIVDIKTVQSAAPHAFGASMYRYGYVRQAAFYLDSFNAVFDPPHTVFESFAFIVIEKGPNLVAVYEVKPDDLARARLQYQRLLALYAECAYTNRWPGYPEEIRYIDLPDWATVALYEEGWS